MGRRTNLLLLDGEDRIVDCLRRVEGDLTQARPLLPGMFYQYPAPQPGKKNPGPSPPPTGRSCWRWDRGGPGGPVPPGSLHGPVAPAGPGAGL
ncbi:MAG: NFACT family protein [Evtepia gabavorous]